MRDPAVLFYSQDFITGTLLMSDEQRGKYIMLLCLQHQHDKLTEKDMLKICGGYDADIWAKFRKDEQGFFYNERLLLETERRSKYNQSRRKNLKTDAHMDAHMETCNKKYEIEDREFEFKKEIAAFENYPVEMLTAFFNYWSEPNKSKTKMRFELQKTFDLEHGQVGIMILLLSRQPLVLNIGPMTRCAKTLVLTLTFGSNTKH
jgi:uncharacterized protein YdaU (DUF1376 family)